MPLPSVPVQPPLPLDAVGTAVSAYGLRLLMAAYSGPLIEVRRTSDNALADIGAVNGELDVAALETHCAGTDGLIRTWYDQSGNAANAIQTTAGSQPQIVSAGTVHRLKGKPAILFSGGPQLNATVASTAINASTVVAVLKNNNKAAENSYWYTLLSGSNTSGGIQTSGEALKAITYATPGGAAYLTTTPTDAHMLYSYGAIAVTTFGSQIKFYRNDILLQSFTPSSTGASGTTVRIGSSVATNSNSLAELIVYGSEFTQAQITSVAAAVNAYHIYGPINPRPALALEERLPWDKVFRDWMVGLTPADVTVNVSTITWDGTYADTDELMRIALTLGVQGYTDYYHGLLTHNRFWVLLEGPDGAGIESINSGITQQNGRDLRAFCDGNLGSPAAAWATWYAYSLPKAGGAEGNPFYHQRAVAVRALIQAMLFGIRYSKTIDQSQDYYVNHDFVGGTYYPIASIFELCRAELPLHVQNAYLEMIRYVVARQYHVPQHGINPNMEMKTVEFFAYAYAHVDDAETKTRCVEGSKLILFGSSTGTPETTTGYIYSNAGHILEGQSPETTYNGQALNHLIGALHSVFGDPSWDFLQAVCDRMLQFKGEQYFVQSDGSFDGPSGYAGRTGGSRVGEQGFETDTFACVSAYSLYGRPFHAALGDEASLVSGINASISTANARFATSMDILTGTGCHTAGIDTGPRSYTVQISPANTLTIANHGIPDGTVVKFSRVSSTVALPAPLDYGVFYWVVNSTTNTLQLAATSGGAAITLTDVGVGESELRTPVVLTDAPDLSYAAINNLSDYLILADGTVWYIRSKDTTNDLLFIDGSLNIPSGSPVSYAIEYGPQKYQPTALHWSYAPPKLVPDGYYDAQRARIVANDASLKVPWELAATFNISRGPGEFWMYKDTDGTRQFGWMIEHLEFTGQYGGWWGGSLQAFWVSDIGTIVQSRHDKAGSDAGENTRVWSLVDTWATQQVWGFDSADKKFSTGWCDNKTFVVDADIVGPPKYVSVTGTFGPAVDSGKGLEPATAITGTFTLATTFTAETDGLTINVAVTHTGTDTFKQMWATLPVFLRDGGQAASTEATIHYWTGTNWSPLTTTIVVVEWLRLSRDFGSGVKSTWINFAAPSRVCLNAAVWTNTYQGDGRYRTIKVDLHGNPGTAIAWPASVSTTYAITLTDPGLTATEPSIEILMPTAATVFPEGRHWAFRATVDWIGAAGTVEAEYTVNGTDWLSIGAMTNVETNVWDYVGGTVPTGVTAVRVQAIPAVGNTGTLQVAATSSAETLVFEDNFTAANGTAVNASYTNWTTNTTGNAYVNLEGTDPIAVTSNTAGASGDNSTTTQYATVIDVGNADTVVEALMKYGSTHAAKRAGVISRIQSENAFCNAIASPSSGFVLRWNNQVGFGNPSSTPSVVIDGTPLASTVYRIVLQTIGNCAIMDVYDGGTHIGMVYRHGLTLGLTDQRVGFVAPTAAATPTNGTIDAFKVWTI